MLTKDLIRYRVVKGQQIKPRFVAPDDSALLDQATALTEVFNAAIGSTRAELEEETARLIEAGHIEAVISRGLEKLLMDRTDFETPEDEERPAFRQKVFESAFHLLGSEAVSDMPDYVDAVEQRLGMPLGDIRTQLYNDLPMFHPVVAYNKITPDRLLHLYNLAHVQWLLLHCQQLEITLHRPKAAKLRQLFKSMRFQQLLALIERPKRGVTKLIISGPLSLFAQTRKYGMNLANFFPAVLHQPEWELKAVISPRKNTAFDLELDQTCGIEPQKLRFTAYTPKEVQGLHKGLTKQLPDWTIEPAGDFVPLTGDLYCFPDFTLVHPNGFSIALELFHRWHQSHLLARLGQLKDNTDHPLLLGVARALTKDKTVASALADSRYFQQYGFVFNDIPSSREVASLAEKTRNA